MLWFHRVINGLLVIVILSTIAVTVVQGASGYEHNDLAWALGYVIGYSLLVIIVGMVGIAIHAAVTRSVDLAKWPFVLFTLTYVVLIVSRSVTPRLSSADAFYVRVENRSTEIVPIVNVFGRRDHVRFDSLSADSSAVGTHHGRKIDYSDRNSYSNQVHISWYDGDQWREQTIVDRYMVIGDSLVVIIRRGGSIEIK
jgi:hypothetical protein